ncbi:MAG: SAM-dependent chlorinase/fluorinase [Flavobacteriaceae bacterium]|nr:SAM-dependent chlorinase/fluorinase [Flavobacteriaceae bacterium]
MSIITLTSDFGSIDHRVASIKGCISSLQIGIPMIDITHDIEPHNLHQTAYILKNAYHHFPLGSIHIVAVDSQYHKERKFLVCKTQGHTFIMPDNGLLGLIFQGIKPEKVYEITLNNRFDDVVNFTAVELFAPVAVHLYKGGIPEIIGREITDIKEYIFTNPIFKEAEKMLIGEIIYIDHFGNVVSNIKKDTFDKYFSAFERFTIKIRGYKLNKIVNKITDIIPKWEDEMEYQGKAAALFNESDLLEIAIYRANKKNGASCLMGLNIGCKIYIEFS